MQVQITQSERIVQSTFLLQQTHAPLQSADLEVRTHNHTQLAHKQQNDNISLLYGILQAIWNQADVSSERTCSRKWRDFERTSFPRQPSLGLRLIISTGWSQCYSSLGFGQLWSHSHLKASSWPPMI